MTTDTWFEPTDSDELYGKGKPQSPYDSVRSFESGHYEEYDSTPGNERIRVQHKSGSFKEYQATGNVVHKIVGNGYLITLQDENVYIKGKCSINILGDLEMHVGGDMHLVVDGDFTQTVKGAHNTTIKGDHTHNVEGTHQTTASSTISQAVEDLTVSGNLNVRGDILGQQTISALGNLTAGGHLSIQGSINATGGIPQTGGEPLPHTISGVFPGLGLMINTVGAVDITSGTGTLITAPTNEIAGPLTVVGPITTTVDLFTQKGTTLNTHIHNVPSVMPGTATIPTTTGIG